MAQWIIRPANVPEVDYEAMYHGRDKLFTFKVHYKGYFIRGIPGRVYRRGRFRYADYVHIDYFLLLGCCHISFMVLVLRVH